MQEFKDVHGDQDNVDGVEFNVDTIYVRTNIRKGETCWIYDEIQYTYNEYLALLDKKVDKSNIEQENLILDNAYRVAILEISTGATLNI